MEIALNLQKNNYRIENAVNADVYTLSPENIRGLYKQRRRWYQGLIHNSVKYRKLFFNREYGDFGMLMPLHVLSACILILSTVLFLYYLVDPITTEMHNLSLVGYDITTYVRSLHWNITALDIDYTKTIITGFIVVMGTATFILGHEFAGEKVTKYGITAVIGYLTFYFVLLGFMWIGLLGRTRCRKQKRW